MMSASEAANQSRDKNIKLQHVEKEIEEAIKRGEFSIYYNPHLNDHEEQFLRNLGYLVERDRIMGRYQISWSGVLEE